MASPNPPNPPNPRQPRQSRQPVERFWIVPDYAGGFVFRWEASGGFADPYPWRFTVQEGPSPDGPWEDLSPEVEDWSMWKEPAGSRVRTGKSNVLYFRLRTSTPAGSYFTPSVQPYGTLTRREFLLAREMMRREVLQSKAGGGVECDVWLKAVSGRKCRACTDPRTGETRDTHCPKCLGTGRDPAYYGPYPMWMRFSTDSAHQKDNSQAGTRESRSFRATTTGNPALKQGDVVIDRRTDKRYYAAGVAVTAEVRRVPCLQALEFSEAPLPDAVMMIGRQRQKGIAQP